MSKLSMLAAAAVLLSLPAACTVYNTTETTDPTVSFNYTQADEAEQVADKADDYCDDRYDTDAYLIDTDRTSGGYEATFACR
ncbi:MAG: hypothetical protein RLN99_16285 [Kiloniellaceae bacterium]